MTSYTLVENETQWPEVIAACDAVSVIAIDTEFMRTSTYYPLVGLVQIYTGTECFLIDPVALPDLSPLKDILTRSDLIKVLHACSEDMEVFQYSLGVLPAPIFDTQIAGAALGIGFSMSYLNIVDHYLSISLPKDQTRSDWLARPLSERQLDYAALDVVHLLEVYHEQMKALAGSPKLDWALSESNEMGVDIPTMTDPESCYLKVKGLWQFDRRQLYLLRKLFAWRENISREENTPRNRVVDQKALITIVKERLDQKPDLQHVAELSYKQMRKYADEILEMISESQQVSEADCPDQMERTDVPIDNKRLKKLKKVAEVEAEKLSVSPELLIRRRFLEKLIRSEDSAGEFHLPTELLGWRKDVIGIPLLQALAEG